MIYLLSRTLIFDQKVWVDLGLRGSLPGDTPRGEYEDISERTMAWRVVSTRSIAQRRNDGVFTYGCSTAVLA